MWRHLSRPESQKNKASMIDRFVNEINLFLTLSPYKSKLHGIIHFLVHTKTLNLNTFCYSILVYLYIHLTDIHFVQSAIISFMLTL